MRLSTSPLARGLLTAGILIVSWCSVWAPASATPATEGDGDEAPFVLIDFPEGQLRSKPDACPIRIEIPVGELFEKRNKSLTLESVQAVKCRGAKLQVLKLQSSQRTLDANLKISSEIFLPPGADQQVRIHYWLYRGDELLGEGLQYLKADEGELNWGSETEMTVSQHEWEEGPEPTLRIEASFELRD